MRGLRRLRVLAQLIRADFLERTRRYSFLITLGVMIYIGYLAVPSAESNALTVDLGNIRGTYNSAWIGSMIALISSMVLSLPGFYLVKNAIERDRKTGTGQIIATTPLSKPLYTLGKAMSNFVFLTVIIAVVAIAAGGMQFIRGESMRLDLWALLAPFLFTTLPTLLLVAAVAVLFESISFLRSGFGNVAYFVLWTAAIMISMSGVSFGSQGVIEEPVNDLFGASVVAASMHEAAHATFPEKNLDLGIGYTKVEGEIQTFRWEGVAWSADVLLGRLLWVGIALGIALSSALFFHRFDPSRGGQRPSERRGVFARALAPVRFLSLPSLDLWRRISLPTPPLPPFGRVLVAEVRLMLKGLPWWWYVGALGLVVAGAVEGVDPEARRGLLGAAWIWPVLVWSGLGVRERTHRTGPIVFSSPQPLGRQFVGMWVGGTLVTFLTGSGVGLRLVTSGAWNHLLGWGVAVFFIPTLALALGVWSGTSKFFEALYVAVWYIGPISGLAIFDYMGLSQEALHQGLPFIYLGLTAALLLAALIGRWRQVRG
jgi:hypothetical protein